MAISPRIMAATACLAVLVGAPGIALLHASHEDTEGDLLSRIQREHDPVKKAKEEIRLADLKLIGGAKACERDDHDACPKLLSAYLELMKSSWKDLNSSGRNAVKQPSGFKELDIALREDAHSLEDLKHRMPIEDRAALDPVIHEVERIHDEVIGALFPSGNPRPIDKSPTPHAESRSATGKIE